MIDIFLSVLLIGFVFYGIYEAIRELGSVDGQQGDDMDEDE